ncbi:MAG: LPS assembly lipoprotein LptE [Limisphaerales bacterium]
MRAVPALRLALALVSLTGCAGYRLGSTAAFPAGQHSIQIGLIQNQTLEPRLIESLNNALRKRFQQDGTYKLDTRGESDVVLTGVITRFDRAPLSFQPADVLTVRDYALGMVAKITVKERATGKILFDREVSGRTTIRAGTDLTSAERQAVPLLAEDLARNAASLIVDGNW